MGEVAREWLPLLAPSFEYEPEAALWGRVSGLRPLGSLGVGAEAVELEPNPKERKSIEKPLFA